MKDRIRPRHLAPSLRCDPSQRAAALQRFEWLYESLRDEVSTADAAALGEILGDPRARTASKERALILLAMLGSARAEALLEWFDAAGAHWRVRWLHRLACRECARRRGARAEARAGAPKEAHAPRSYASSKSASTASGGRPSAAFSPAITTGRSISAGCSHIAAMRSSRLSVSSSRLRSL